MSGSRNIFNAADEVDMEVLAMVTSHVRRVLSKLGTIDDDVVLNGRIRFGLPTEEAEEVKKKSHFLETLTEATTLEEASAA
jgi:cytochrome b pre-mRNA-processing protein 3